MQTMRLVLAMLGTGALACATASTTAPASGGNSAISGAGEQTAPEAPAAARAKQEELCAAQPEATRSKLTELLAKVNADLKANGKKIKISVSQVDNSECSISSSKGKLGVDVIQSVTLSIEVSGQAPALASAHVSTCYTLTPVADSTSYEPGPCENDEVLERYNVESAQTAINDELYKLEKIRIQID